MIERDITEWRDFRKVIDEFRQEFGLLRFEDKFIRENEILYRGHRSSKWGLETTLERFSESTWDEKKYCRLIRACLPQIESFTGKKWGIPHFPEIKKELNDKTEKYHPLLPYYDYWVYLRHHGFPSPLLDWTRSPYIAAFFAFSERTEAEAVSVFMYIERPRGIKGGTIGEAAINVHGPYVSTHQRHFLQQAIYTTCTKYDYSNEGHIFMPHQAVFSQDDHHKDQDTLIKINIPSSERMNVLKELYQYNINYFSLMQSEESLVRNLAYLEIEERNL